MLAETRETTPPTRNDSKWIRFPYLGPLSQKLLNELKKFNYKTGFYPLTQISYHLTSNKDPVPPEKHSGLRVHRINSGHAAR